MKKRVLVLGAGRVARPLVQYLLDQPSLLVTVTSLVESEAIELVNGHPSGSAESFTVDETDELRRLVAEHELTVSLLPAPLHPMVARACLDANRHLVTASYVSDEIRSLDQEARERGVLILKEMGVDPGLDHMSAMRIIHDVRRRGGWISSFKSYCGGIPAPETEHNPWGYKFSWSPRAVLTAGKNDARYRSHGEEIHVPSDRLFAQPHTLYVDGVGELEAYPNRHSLIYIDLYEFRDIRTMLRGTLRWPGWCQTMSAVSALGLLDEEPRLYPAGTRWIDFMRAVLQIDAGRDPRAAIAKRLGLSLEASVLRRFEWLGLFGEEPMPELGLTTVLDALAARMAERMGYAPGEHDMIVMRHDFIARFPDRPGEHIVSTLVERGHQPDGDTAMARTVGLPAAIAARLVLEGKIQRTGVHIPVSADIYAPILEELEATGIRFVDTVEPAGEPIR